VSVDAIAWSADGALIATASEDGYVRLWDAASHALVGELPGHDTTIPGTGARTLGGLAFAPDGRTLYVSGAPGGTPGIAAHALG
jgi:WD40 repeat protein